MTLTSLVGLCPFWLWRWLTTCVPPAIPSGFWIAKMLVSAPVLCIDLVP